MRRKYVFFDIDHTLVSHAGQSHVPPETRKALRLLRENGHVPAIATGRSVFLTRSVAKELGIDLLVCTGGAHILNGAETLHEAWLSTGALEALRSTARRWPQITAAMDDHLIYTDNDNPDWREYFASQAGYPCVRPLSEMRRALSFYLMARPPLAGDYGLFTTPLPGVLVEPMQDFVEARVDGVSKWSGIRCAMGSLGADTADAIPFGDGLNDVEMLRCAGTSVAVGGACPEAKAAASFIAGDIDEGGILDACVELGLIPQGEAGSDGP